MKIKDAVETCGPMGKEHGHYGHFKKPEVLNAGHNTNWIKGAIKHPGALTRKAKKEGETPMDFAHEHDEDSGTTGRQARLAETLSKFRK